MFGAMKQDLAAQLEQLRSEGLEKPEHEITTPQGAQVGLADGSEVLNLCANNYLGLAGDTTLVENARDAGERWVFGMASVRYICGTQTLPTDLGADIARFRGTVATILYSSCFDANTGLFETLFGAEDAIISDELNHASIIDGIRLTKSRRLRYRNRDMADLQDQLRAATDARYRRSEEHTSELQSRGQ